MKFSSLAKQIGLGYRPAAPTFIIIGAAKSGTTSLYQMLLQHPEVFLSTPKEVRYFSDDSNFQRGWEWYLNHFSCPKNAEAIGECSPHYSMAAHAPEAAKRIAQSLPDVKLIYMVRNPMDRIISHYRMYQRSGDEKFEDFNRDFLEGTYRGTLLDPSLYWYQISRYREYFADEQIYVMFYEDFVQDPTSEFAKVCKFLEINESVEVLLRQANRNESAVEISPVFNRFPINYIWRAARKVLSESIYQQFLQRLPESITYKVVKGDACWTQETYAQAIDPIREDAEKFLGYAGKSEGYWDLDYESFVKET